MFIKSKQMTKIYLFISFLLAISSGSYIPELILTTTAEFFNKQLSVNIGPNITQFANHFKVPNQTFDDKFDGIHISMNLTNITQKVQTNWDTNLINVTGNHNFSILAKNINITIKGQLQFYIASKALRQKGQLQIQIDQLEAHTSYNFIRTSCPKSIGFGLFVNDILIDSSKFIIDIKDKKLDNYIIRLIEGLVKSRVPNIINTKVRDTLNEAINKATCNGLIQEIVPIGYQSYVVSINTTDVPYFADRKILTIPLDLNFQNQRTNDTNQEVDNQNLVEQHIYENQANCTLSLSSNMIDTALWLIDDSNILSFAVNKSSLGPNPPISLDTTGLSIILPGLRKFPNKDVIVRVNTSSQFSEVFIRSGRFLSALSVSADFIINDTSRITDLQKCLKLKECFVATTLNITLGVSASVRASKMNFWSGLIQSLYIHEVKVIQPSLIDVKIENLIKILNPLISSARPQLNKALQSGFVFNPSSIQKIKKLNLTAIIGQTFLDYASFGLKFDI